MLRFIRGRGPHASSERLKHHKDVFTFQKTIPHGFPHHPTALGYDHELGLIAIATKKGQLRVYGKPGVEYHADLDCDSPVRQIQFVPGKRGQLILLHEEGLIQLYEVNYKEDSNEVTLDKVRSTEHFLRNEGNGSQYATTVSIVPSSPTSSNIIIDTSNTSSHPPSPSPSPASSTIYTCINVYVGTQGGNIYSLDLETFELSNSIIYQDVVLQNVPAEQKKSSQGSVEVIAPQPYSNGTKLLIGYQRGILVLWDVESCTCQRFYNSSQQLQSASWQSQGDQFITSHNDGSYILWNVTDDITPSESPKIPYGPFPCKPITKILRKTTSSGDDYLFLSGGMPRASYGEKLTVSIIQGDLDGSNSHHVLEFTSKVIDFVTVDTPNEHGKDNPVALIVLLDEEIVAIDLQTPEWLQFKLPYLSSVHSSGITSCQHYSDLPEEVIKQILAAGKKQDEGKYSTNKWPILGGVVRNTNSPSVGEPVQQQLQQRPESPSEAPGDVGEGGPSATVAALGDGEERSNENKVHETSQGVGKNNSLSTVHKDILITGHEDGSICFWDASGVNLSHILSVNTRKLFLATDGDIAPIDGDDVPGGESLEDEWPPFRKVGTFDPYSDDPRLAIRRIALCPMTGFFVAAGTAGQVLIMKVGTEASESPLTCVTANLVEEATGFAWKGHDQLHVKMGSVKLDPGYQPEIILQITPPAAVTALSLNSEWGLLSAGTAHGFVVFDSLVNKVLFTKTTLNLADLAATSGGDVLISRRKSFKKSLRESFRRLRKSRSMRGGKKHQTSTTATASPSSPTSDDAATSSAASSKVTSPVRSLASPGLDDDTRPVERQIEAKQDDGLGSMVRTLYFALSPITSSSTSQPSLWVGTNAGAVFLHSITLPADEKRQEESVTVTLAKEIQLKHKAPVIFIQVVDSTGYPIPGPYEVATGKVKAPSSVGSQRVLIVSEEQFKLFTLPSLKPERKTKLTAHEGSRVRRVAVAHFASKVDQKFTEHCMVCLSNQGEVAIYSISDLKRLRNHSVTKRDDVHGMSSLVFTSEGEGLYLHTPSEFMRFTMSAKKIVTATGHVVIPENARPVKDPKAAVTAPVASSDAGAVNESSIGNVLPGESSNHKLVQQVTSSHSVVESNSLVNEANSGNRQLQQQQEHLVVDGEGESEPSHSTPIASQTDVSIAAATSPPQPTVSPIKVPESNDSATLSVVAATTAVETNATAAHITNNTLQLEQDLQPVSLPTVSEVEPPPTSLIPDPIDATESTSTEIVVSSVVTHEVIHSESVSNGKVNGHNNQVNGKSYTREQQVDLHEQEGEEEDDEEDGEAFEPHHQASFDGKELTPSSKLELVSNGSTGGVHAVSSVSGNGLETDESLVTANDITIDSVRDFTNLSLSDHKQQQHQQQQHSLHEQAPGSGLKGEKPKKAITPPPEEHEEQVEDQLLDFGMN